MKLKSQLLLILFATALLVFFYVWPGVFRYQYYVIEGVGRIDKLSGTFQLLRYSESSGGWSRIRGKRYIQRPKVTHWHWKDDCPLCLQTEDPD